MHQRGSKKLLLQLTKFSLNKDQEKPKMLSADKTIKKYNIALDRSPIIHIPKPTAKQAFEHPSPEMSCQ